MKIGGTVAFWVKIAIGVVLGYAVYKLYSMTKGFTTDVIPTIKNWWSNTALGVTIPTTETLAAEGVDVSHKDYVYDAALDTRSWWEKLFTMPSESAFRAPDTKSNDVGVSLPTPTPATVAPAYLQSDSTINEFGYAITQD